MKTVTVHLTKPTMFNPQMEVVGLYLTHGNELLLLQNSIDDSEPEKWGVPGGKLEKNEAPLVGALRELFEETSIVLTSETLTSMGMIYFRKRDLDFIFHLFLVKISTKPKVQLSAEHQDYRWIFPEEIEEVSLLEGGEDVYARYREFVAF